MINSAKVLQLRLGCILYFVRSAKLHGTVGAGSVLVLESNVWGRRWLREI